MKDLSKSRKFWNTLTDFKNAIETSGTKEKVKYFDGHKLITNKFEYTMLDRQISRIELK